MHSLVCTVLTALGSLTIACGAESNSTAEEFAALPATADGASVRAASAVGFVNERQIDRAEGSAVDQQARVGADCDLPMEEI